MRTYADLIAAARDTAAKISRTGRAHVAITTLGGRTASVNMPTKRGGPITINLPTLPEDARMTQGEADTVLGYLLHELAHVLETDQHAWRRAVASGSVELRDLVNGIEDVRIERTVPAKHGLPGAAELFAKLFADHWRELRAARLERKRLLPYQHRRAGRLPRPRADRAGRTGEGRCARLPRTASRHRSAP